MRRTRVTILIMGLISIVSLAGCGSSDQITVPADNRGIQADTTPALAEMEQVLQAELARLGKSTMQAGDYQPPSGTGNTPFDLHALLIDPDGAGGADPLGVHVTWTERLVGDYNMDGLVNASDLTPIGQYYGQTVAYRDAGTTGSVEYWPEGTAMDLPSGATSPWQLARIDGNGDGLINLQDITAIGQHWQERITGYSFHVSRNGSNPQAVPDPVDSMELYMVDFNESHLKDLFDADWPNVPVMHEVDLPVPALVDDVIHIKPHSGNETTGEYTATCTLDTASWRNGGPIMSAWYCLRDAFVVKAYYEGEIQGYRLHAQEYVRGDLDGNGVCHGIESTLLEKYLGAVPADYEIPVCEMLERLDWNQNGMVELSDLNLIGATVDQRLDGLAFAERDGVGYTPVMDESDSELRFVVPREVSFFPARDYNYLFPEQAYVYSSWLPGLTDESQVGICAVSSGNPEPEISDPVYYQIVPGVISSRLTDNAEMVCVLANRGFELNGQTSYSDHTVIEEYAWYIDGSLEPDFYGDTLSTDRLEPGEHTVYLRVSDGYGNTAEVGSTVHIAD